MGIYEFWIIGKPETNAYSDRILRMVKDLKLQNKIKFWGYVSQDKKYELLSKSSVLVNPSVHEGWGLVNIEANAVGTPVVSYNSAGLIDSVSNGKSGIVLMRNSPQEMARTVSYVINNKSLYSSLRSGAQKWSRNFTWNLSKVRSLDLIKKVVK